MVRTRPGSEKPDPEMICLTGGGPSISRITGTLFRKKPGTGETVPPATVAAAAPIARVLYRFRRRLHVDPGPLPGRADKRARLHTTLSQPDQASAARRGLQQARV